MKTTKEEMDINLRIALARDEVVRSIEPLYYIKILYFNKDLTAKIAEYERLGKAVANMIDALKSIAIKEE